MNRRHARSLILIAAASGVLTACSKPDPGMGETRKLIMGTFTEDSVTDRAGKAVAATISNTVPGVYVETWPSKGAYMNIEHLFDGTYDLVIVPAGAAYEAYTGTGACEGEKKEKLRAVAACYPIVSTWISPKKLGLSKVQELKGHPLAVGNEGSETAKVSGEVFDVLGIRRSGIMGSRVEPTGSGTSGLMGSMRSRSPLSRLTRSWRQSMGSGSCPTRTKNWMRS